MEHGTSRLEGALHLAALGYRIFPARTVIQTDGHVDKPPCPGILWRRAATSDPGVIRQWWSRWPEAYPAIACGESGIVAIDVDPRNGGTWEEPGPGYDTGGGGRHVLYAEPRVPIGNDNTGKVAPGVDVRGDGGYVLCWQPSKVIVGPGDLPPLSERVLSVMTRGAPTVSQDPGHTGHILLIDPFQSPERTFSLAEAAEYVRREALDPLRVARPGGRNAALNSAAMVCGHFAEIFWPVADLTAGLTEIARSIGLDDREIGPTIRSGLNAGRKTPYRLREEGSDTPETPAEDGDDQDPDTWEPVPLGDYLDGLVIREPPSLGMARSDGLKFLYPAKEHSVIGEMESGKSWFALACVAEELLANRGVIYIHWEESDASDTVERLLALGVPKEKIRANFHFVAPEVPGTADRVRSLCALKPALVVHDGVNEAMGVHGWEMNQPDGPAAFRAALTKPFTKSGAAVLSCDHVTKNRETRGRGAIGSVHKGNGLNGVSIMLENEEAFGRGARGRSHVFVVKDRPGFLRRHGRPTDLPGKTFMGELVVDDTRQFVSYLDVKFHAPRPVEDAGVDTQDTDAVAVLAVIRELEAANAPANLRAVRGNAPIRGERVDGALERLKLRGQVVERVGVRGARMFASTVSQDHDQ